nr:PREDICTED: kinesin-like protein KIF6 isoform X2 [Megachile rotundata]
MTNNDNPNINEKNIKIFVRVFPVEKSCESCAKIDTERKKIYIRCLQEMQPNRIATVKKPSYWCFQIDDIFHDSSQEEVYRVSTEELVPKILDGVSCILMGFGQTGSGKSFTISGVRNNWEHRGLVVRLISDMFAEKMHRKKSNKIQYCVSYVELHGKEAKDLLIYDTENRVRINERDPFKDISMVLVENEEEALRKIFEGEVRRSTVKGSRYSVSHLATAVITFHVSNISLITSWGTVTMAKMHIVEVAGIGTVGKNNCWKAAMDVGIANLTKTQLEQFFSYLSEERISASTLIRSSNLLKILGSAFSVSSIIRFISHIRIKEEDLNITLSTLRFTAKIAKLKPVRVKENVQCQPDLLLYRLQDEVNALKKELMMNDLFLHQESPMNVSKSRMEQINRSVFKFLDGKISDFTLFNVSQAQTLLKIIKDLYNRLTSSELEVAKLKETYENVLKSTAQMNTQSAKEDILPTDSRRNIQEIEKSTEETSKEVGSLNEFGMTLGPYKREEKEEKLSAEGMLLNKKYSLISGQIHKIDITEVRQMFENFLKEKREYARIKAMLDKIGKMLNVMRPRFSNTMEKYFQAKRNLDNVRDALSKHQQIRYIMEPEVSNNVKQEIPEIEKMIHRDILCHEKILINLEEEVKQEQDEIDKLFEQYAEMCSKLESGFREYCKTMDLLLYHNDKPMKMLLEPVEQKSLETMRQKFNKFQRAMFRKIELKKEKYFDMLLKEGKRYVVVMQELYDHYKTSSVEYKDLLYMMDRYTRYKTQLREDMEEFKELVEELNDIVEEEIIDEDEDEDQFVPIDLEFEETDEENEDEFVPMEVEEIEESDEDDIFFQEEIRYFHNIINQRNILANIEIILLQILNGSQMNLQLTVYSNLKIFLKNYCEEVRAVLKHNVKFIESLNDYKKKELANRIQNKYKKLQELLNDIIEKQKFFTEIGDIIKCKRK